MTRTGAGTPSGSRPLNARELLFCREYLKDFNAGAAAARAGFAPRNQRRRGWELMQREDIRDEIARVAEKVADKAEVSAEEVIRELALLLRSDVRHFVVGDGELTLADGAPDAAWRAVSSVKHKTRTIPRKNGDDPITEHDVEFRLWSKTETARMLGEYFKLYTQKQELVMPPGSGVLAVPVPTAEQWVTAAAKQQADLLKPAAAP